MNLKTGTGLNKQVASHLYNFVKEKKNKDKEIYIYVFVDREGSKLAARQFDGKSVKRELEKRQINIKNIKSMESVEAIKMIESWFFYDLEGICGYIGLKLTESLKRKYVSPHSLDHTDLSKLFKKGTVKKHYNKGDSKFLDVLNVELIVSKCSELKSTLDSINKEFNNK